MFVICNHVTIIFNSKGFYVFSQYFKINAEYIGNIFSCKLLIYLDDVDNVNNASPHLTTLKGILSDFFSLHVPFPLKEFMLTDIEYSLQISSQAYYCEF